MHLIQILEKEKDKLMERTATRPLPQGIYQFFRLLFLHYLLVLLGLFCLIKSILKVVFMAICLNLLCLV